LRRGWSENELLMLIALAATGIVLTLGLLRRLSGWSLRRKLTVLSVAVLLYSVTGAILLAWSSEGT
jgi:hypothetical protein